MRPGRLPAGRPTAAQARGGAQVPRGEIGPGGVLSRKRRQAATAAAANGAVERSISAVRASRIPALAVGVLALSAATSLPALAARTSSPELAGARRGAAAGRPGPPGTPRPARPPWRADLPP